MFQFQTGSIKSARRQHIERVKIRFQFQTGSIKSMMDAEKLRDRFDKFQFQTGSIKRFDCSINFVQRLFSFNSKLVRLKVYATI